MSDGIVVGYDGSAGSERALRWAMREARERGSALTACLVWTPDSLAPRDDATARQRGEEILTRGLAHARARLGADRIRPRLTRGRPAEILCGYSAAAEMVVVGARGHGGLGGPADPAGPPIGSVAWQLASYGHGPVVIVRGHWRPPNHPPGPIVVGVDGSAACQAAIPFAFHEAMLRDVPLVAVCATADAPGTLGGARQLEETFSQVMTEQEKEYPDTTVFRQVCVSSPRTALLRAAAEAQLLVVGARGRGGLAGMTLGSVAHVMMVHAPCPVTIIHSPEHEEVASDERLVGH